MSTTDIPTILADALHREAAATSVTDSHLAVRRLERSVRAHRQRRLVLALAAAAVAVGVLAAGAALVGDDDRAEVPPAERHEQARELPPPGHRVVYAGAEQVVVVSDRGGGRPIAVLDGAEPRFDPGGSRVAYVDAGGSLAVAVVDGAGAWPSARLDAPPAARPDDGATGVYGPVWSPDGSRVAYMANSQLRVVDVVTGAIQVLRDFRAPYVRPMDWTPDGAALVLGFDRSTTGGEMVVETFDLTTKRLTPFLDGAGETTGVRFSPDGTRIAFYSDSLDCICVAEADGSGARTVLAFEDGGAFPDNVRLAWAPDGTALVWDDRRTGQVSLLDLATGTNRALPGVAGRSAEIDWDRP